MKDEIARAAIFGIAAGVLATIVMDIFVALAMQLMGNPVTTMFSFIGDTASAAFRLLNMRVAGGVLPGFVIHYLFGMALGKLFCVAMLASRRFRIDTIGRRIVAGILFIEACSQPFLALPPLVLPMSGADILQWYGLATVMHALYGAILGVAEHYRPVILSPRAKPISA